MTEKPLGFLVLPEDRRNALICAGLALEMIQKAEHMFADVISMVFHPSDRISVASLESGEALVRSKTLGQLMRELQRRADVHQDVEALLRKFLTSRNEFVHRLGVIEATQGKDAAASLTSKVLVEGYAVVRFLCAVTMFWAEDFSDQVKDLDLSLPPELADIEAMIPRVPYLVRRKQQADTP